jgi:NADH-quinone oxidoreductase subunit A
VVFFFSGILPVEQERTSVHSTPSDPASLWSFALYFVLVTLLLAAMLGASYLIGQRHRERATGDPYESGIVPTGSAQVRFDVKFYLVAIFFLVFDLEAVFVYAWAVSLREAGWPGYVEMLVFIAVLGAALAYLWRRGALDWGKKRPAR